MALRIPAAAAALRLLSRRARQAPRRLIPAVESVASPSCAFSSGRDGSSSSNNSETYAQMRVAAQTDKWRKQAGAAKTKSLSFQVDRSELKRPALVAKPPASRSVEKSRETPLVHLLRTMIEVKGPLSVAEFMSRALSHPEHGYYMKRDVFGRQGDFTTAPEISQMFGELVGVWCVATWQQMGTPASVQVVELGPGRGSLMSDFLRAARSFPPFYKALDVHMVEISPALRKIQQETLGCEEIDDAASAANKMRVGADGPTVRWHDELAHVPHAPSLFIAQELFDALPVHQFEYTELGWCERLVDVDYEDGEDHFRFVLSPGATPAARVYIGREKVYDPSNASPVIINPHAPQPQQQQPVVTSAVKTPDAQVGDRIEISPVGIALAQDIARRVAEHGGGALIVDYGHDHPSPLSLRGIKEHEFVSVLREPGDVDLSIDVDFATLRRFATQEAPDVVVAAGPIGQGQFLRNMGIEHRLAALLQSCESDEQAQELFSSYERLVEPDQMGTIFKAMALTHASLGAPIGFELHSEGEGGDDQREDH